MRTHKFDFLGLFIFDFIGGNLVCLLIIRFFCFHEVDLMKFNYFYFYQVRYFINILDKIGLFLIINLTLFIMLMVFN